MSTLHIQKLDMSVTAAVVILGIFVDHLVNSHELFNSRYQ